MPPLSEDNYWLMHLLEQNQPLFDECFRVAQVTLDQHPPEQDRTRGILNIAANARYALAQQLPAVVGNSSDTEIVEHLTTAFVDWQHLARELIAAVFVMNDDG